VPAGTAVVSVPADRNMVASPGPSPYGSSGSGAVSAGTAASAATGRGQRRQRAALATATSSRAPMRSVVPVRTGMVGSAVSPPMLRFLLKRFSSPFASMNSHT
jgi:hypothetical protein